MASKKVARMMAQKLQQKRQQEEEAQPRLPVLQAQFENANRAHDELAELAGLLRAELEQERQSLAAKTAAVKELSDMTRTAHPVISIQPDFYGSDAIPLPIKDFYRRGRNTFVRLSLSQNSAHQNYRHKQQEVKDAVARIRDLEASLRKTQGAFRRDAAEHRVRNTGQRLSYEEAARKNEELAARTQALRSQNGEVEGEYSFKNVLSRPRRRG